MNRLLWARMQPECFSDRSGKEDKRAAYGLLAQEMMAWLNQFQHIRDKDIIIVGTLGQYLDDCNRSTWLPQCEGAKTASEIPGIVDEVISMVGIKKDDGTEKRLFVCQTIMRRAIIRANLYDIRASTIGKIQKTRRGSKVGKHEFIGGFAAVMPKGNSGIFKREGRAALPIKEVKLPLEPEASRIILLIMKLKRYLKNILYIT